MYKLVLFAALAVFYMLLLAKQTDEELAVRLLFTAKHAVNRAAHAAAQQTDPEKLKRGVFSIEPQAAVISAYAYLQRNLRLDASMDPLPGTFLRSRVEVVALDIINEDAVFPFTYRNEAYNYTVKLERPAVIVIAKVRYPRTYNFLPDITWNIKSAAELVYP